MAGSRQKGDCSIFVKQSPQSSKAFTGGFYWGNLAIILSVLLEEEDVHGVVAKC